VADYTKVIPPGQEGTIKAKIDGKKVFAGYLEKILNVKTNDPVNADMVLTIQFTVKKVFDISSELNWTGFQDENVKLETIITNLMPTPINVKGFEWAKASKDKQLDTKLAVKLETIEKGKKYKLTIIKKKDIPPDRYYGEIALLTDYPKMPQKILTFNINVVKDVEVYPERIFFGEMVIEKGTSKSFDRAFNVIAARGDSLKIVKVVPSSSEITVKIQEQTPGKSFKGTVWVRPPDKLGQYVGNIKIYTNYPKYKELILDIVGSVRYAEPNEPKPSGN
jgi:hypothetical protein